MREFMSFDRNLKLRTLTVFLTVLLGSAVGPNMTIYYVRYFGAFITGMLLLLIAVSGFFAGLVGGYLSDKIGRKPVMLVAAAMMIGGYFIAMLMNSPWITNHHVTYIGFFMASVGASFADPAEQAMMIDASTTENRNFVFALIYWVINIGVMIGAAIGGWFFQAYLFELMLALVGVGLINGAIVLFLMSETYVPTVQEQTTFFDGVKSYVSVLADRRFLLFLIGSVAAITVMMQPDYYLATHLGESFKTTMIYGVSIYGQRMLSLMMILNTAMIVLIFGVVTRLMSRLSLTMAFALGMMIQGIGFAVAFLVNSFWPALLATVIFTVGEMMNVAPSQTIRAKLMNPTQLGAYSGAFSASRPVGMMVASGMVSMSQRIGNVGCALLIIGITILATYLVLKADRMPANFVGLDE
ncbi:MFS transporter [Weissella diestrammenae]|uniref:MFS transporter n=1 Tax=Weissella diestrammenae TaxID=1162633 RepID=A0A7G9T739_9LACO|nr:MFS transporter [Weissella diestrammenae]MCM0582487.1 MFS transporter [Weissella diestrammenae]QNN75914.1 MFS transporter [Weissella diestrammenae]